MQKFVYVRTYVCMYVKMERSAEEIKGLSRTYLKRGVNIVDQGSSVYYPVIKKPHVDVLTSKPNINTSSTSPVFGINAMLTMPVLPHVSTQLSIPVPLHTRTTVKKLKKPSSSKEPTTNSPIPGVIVKLNCSGALALITDTRLLVGSWVQARL